MDLSSCEMYAASGNPIVGATASLYAAVATQPNTGTVLATAVTDTNGWWAFNGIAFGMYDVRVQMPGESKYKWYKGLTKVGVQQVSVGSDAYYQLDTLEPLIINGNYGWWQRVEAAIQTCTTTFDAITSFGPDRMYTLPVGASCTIQRIATVPDYKSIDGAIIGGATSVTTVDHGQRIRSVYQTRYRQPLMFSAYIFNGTGADFVPLLRVDTPGTADSWGAPTNRLSTSLQNCVNNAWTRVSLTFDPNAYTNSALGMSVYVRFPSGSMTATKYVIMSQFRLNYGDFLRAYIPPDRQTERTRLAAFYRKSYTDGTPLQTDTPVGLIGIAAYASAGTNWKFHHPLVPAMWKTPTCRVWGKAGVANKFWIDTPTNTDNDAGSISNATTNGFWVSNATTIAEQVFIHFDAVSELT